MENDIRSAIIKFADAHLGEYSIKSKPNGDELIPDLCPICQGGSHHDKHTFAISLDKGVYVCKRGTCNAHGRFPALAEIFGEKTNFGGQQHVSSKKSEEAVFVQPDVLTFPPTDAIYKYFESRKISRETVDAWNIQSDDKGMIVFPFFMSGNLEFVKFRRPWKPTEQEKGRKEWQLSGTKPILFGMDMCEFSKPLVICEGQIDAMSLYEAGVRNVVSVPCGCDDTRWIGLCWDWLDRFNEIIVFGDNDAPGQKMVREVTKRLGETRCKIVENYPEHDGHVCKDANEILYWFGGFELIDMVDSANEIPVKGLLDLADVPPYDPTTIPRIKTNIPMLDICIGGLAEGGITVFTGKAGDGKSTLGGLLLLNAIEQGLNVVAYSGELPKERFQQWINLQAAGSEYITLKYDRIKGCDVPVVPENVQRRIMDWYRGKFFLFDNNEIFEHNQSESILEVFTMAVRKYNAKLFLVDNLMTSLSDSDEETKAQGKFVNALKKFANKYAVHVIIVAHPRKSKQGESLKRDDVSGSSCTVNLADSAIVVERPNLRIIKARDSGVQRLIECVYCGDSRRVYQADAGDKNMFSWDRDGLSPVPPQMRACVLPQYGEQLAQTEPF